MLLPLAHFLSFVTTTMAGEINQLKIPFLQLPFNLQCTIARKLSAESFHRLAVSSRFIQEFKNWIFPSSSSLYVRHFYEIERIFKRNIALNSIEEFESLCCVKLETITIWDYSADVLKVFVGWLRSKRRICTEMLIIRGPIVDDGELFVELIKLLKPKRLHYMPTFIPNRLVNFLPNYEFDHISFLSQPEIADLFKSLKFTSINCACETIPPMDIIRVIEEALSGKRSRDTELLLPYLAPSSIDRIFEHFEDRLSLLYSLETHDSSIWSHEEPEDVISYILFSEFSPNSLWIIGELHFLFRFKNIRFEDFDKPLLHY